MNPSRWVEHRPNSHFMEDYPRARKRRFRSWPAAVLVAVLAGMVAGIAGAQTITEFPVPTSFPFGIAAGPDGNLWFTGGDHIGRITTAGVVTEFFIPTASSTPEGIAAGPDGNLWFTEYDANKIGRITTAGVITEFSIPTADSTPAGIAAGPDGNLWFTQDDANQIGRITPAGVITEFSIPTGGSHPQGIAAGPDGNLWFTTYRDHIGRITVAGVITEFSIPTASSGPVFIASGPDGNLWFTEMDANQIGRITMAGVITEFPIPTASSGPAGIAAGPDGNLWFTEAGANKIGRITTAGVVTGEFPLPTTSSFPAFIAAGPDGNLWFTEPSANWFTDLSASKIGRITTGQSDLCVADSTALCLNGSRFRVQADWGVPSKGTSGHGTGVQLSEDTGYFWFFNASNVEMVVKVLDGCGVNGHEWVFAGGLTDVEVTLTVTDTQTGEVKTYVNPASTPFQPIQDTAAFSGCSSSSGFSAFVRPETARPTQPAIGRGPGESPAGLRLDRHAEKTASCVGDTTTLCISSGRFRVQSSWRNPSEGTSGQGTAVSLTGDTGYFWFFNSSNVEMIVKVLDGCSVNSHKWVFAGGLTNVEVTLTVTDTLTGVGRTYVNPASTAFLPIQDTAAFATCP